MDISGFLKTTTTSVPEAEEHHLQELDGKTCSLCGHKAHGVWQWAPDHFDGYRCACCLRALWEDGIRELQESLAGLPEECS